MLPFFFFIYFPLTLIFFFTEKVQADLCSAIFHPGSISQRIEFVYPSLAQYMLSQGNDPAIRHVKLYLGFSESWQEYKFRSLGHSSAQKNFEAYELFNKGRDIQEKEETTNYDINKWYMLIDSQTAANYAHRIPAGPKYFHSLKHSEAMVKDVFVAELEVPQFILSIKYSLKYGMSWVIDKREFPNMFPFINRVYIFHIPNAMNIQKPKLTSDDPRWLTFDQAWQL